MFYSHLASVGMERYYDVFRDYGVEIIEDIRFMGDIDFTACGVKPFHRRKLLTLAEASEIVAEPVLTHRFLFEPLFLPVNDVVAQQEEEQRVRKDAEHLEYQRLQEEEQRVRKDAEHLEYQRLHEEGQRLRAEERRARERQAADERRARDARFESKSDEWEVVGRKKIEARQAEQAARSFRPVGRRPRDVAKAEKIRRGEEEKIRRAEEEKHRRAEEKEERRRAEEERTRQAKAESERRRVEKTHVNALISTTKLKAITTPKAKKTKKKTKKKPSPPSNLCRQWKTTGECTYLLAGKKCLFVHPEEWRGGNE